MSGSLRAGSSNSAVLDAARLLAPSGVVVAPYTGLRALPAFDPDLDTPDGTALPPEVRRFRDQVGRADAVLISSPEYAHGIAGALKNALDWLVGSTEFSGRVVALLSTSTRAVHAPAQLIEVVTTMNAWLVPEACVTVPLHGRALDGPAIAAGPKPRGPGPHRDRRTRSSGRSDGRTRRRLNTTRMRPENSGTGPEPECRSRSQC